MTWKAHRERDKKKKAYLLRGEQVEKTIVILT